MSKTKNLVLTALFAAMACAATMVIRIPTPGTGGYIHPGDAIVILSGIFLSPGCAFLAAGIGSCMADLLGGYFIFAIKGVIALLSNLAYRRLAGKLNKPHPAVAVCGLIDVALVAGGYFLCEIPLYGAGAAFASVPSNLVQGIGGLVISTVLFTVLHAIPDVRRMLVR